MGKYSKRKFVKNKRPLGNAKGSRIKKRKSTNRTKNRGKNRKKTMRGGAFPTYDDVLKEVDNSATSLYQERQADGYDLYENEAEQNARKKFEDERKRLSKQNPKLSQEEIKKQLIEFLTQKKTTQEAEEKRKADKLINKIIPIMRTELVEKGILDSSEAEALVREWRHLSLDYPTGKEDDSQIKKKVESFLKKLTIIDVPVHEVKAAQEAKSVDLKYYGKKYVKVYVELPSWGESTERVYLRNWNNDGATGWNRMSHYLFSSHFKGVLSPEEIEAEAKAAEGLGHPSGFFRDPIANPKNDLNQLIKKATQGPPAPRPGSDNE